MTSSCSIFIQLEEISLKAQSFGVLWQAEVLKHHLEVYNTPFVSVPQKQDTRNCHFDYKYVVIKKAMRKHCVWKILKGTVQLVWRAVWIFNTPFLFVWIGVEWFESKWRPHVEQLMFLCLSLPLQIHRPNSCLVITGHLAWRPSICVTLSPF